MKPLSLTQEDSLGQSGNAWASRLLSRRASEGSGWIALSKGMTWICLFLVLCVLLVLFWLGGRTFWPRAVAFVPLRDGSFCIGEWHGSESMTIGLHQLDLLSPAARQQVERELSEREAYVCRRDLFRVGNRERLGSSFRYINAAEMQEDPRHGLPELWYLQRMGHGPAIGFPCRIERMVDEDTMETCRMYRQLDAMLKSSMIDNGSAQDLGEGRVAWMDRLQELIYRDFKGTLEREMVRRQREGWLFADPQRDGPPKGKLSGRSSADRGYALSMILTDPIEVERAWPALMREGKAYRQTLQRLLAELGQVDRTIRSLRTQIGSKLLSTNDPAMVGELDHVLETLAKERWEWESHQKVLGWAMERTELRELRSWLTARQNDLQNRLSDLASKVQFERARFQREGAGPAEADTTDGSSWDRLLSQMVRRMDLQEALQAMRAKGNRTRMVLAIGQVKSANGEQDSERIEAFDRNLIAGSTYRLVQQSREDRTHYRWTSSIEGDSESTQPLETMVIPLQEILSSYRPNQLTLWERCVVYGGGWWEFLTQDPREAITEGGVFPAIWGTIVLTMAMSLLVIPFGVITALYLAEYSRSGPMIRLVRICINNLAGVPSIVYGLFGLVFFCHGIGAFMDGGPQRAGWPPLEKPIWFVGLWLTCGLSAMAFLLGWKSSSNARSTSVRRSIAGLTWLLALVGAVGLVATSPYFHGFYQSSLPSATFGHRAILWASMTMALLTAPVVIVASEEAIQSVPRRLREGAYACGANQWQTIVSVVIPYALPGILTGCILAIARGAGEVAPLILVGAIPSAVDLPLDAEYPYFHGSRSFMHLGFHMFSLGFQGEDSDASRPMVFTTGLLLVLIVTFLNSLAVWLRSSLRARSQSLDF